MSQIRRRLNDLFLAAFPSCAVNDLASLKAEDYEMWDSLATVALVSLIEEEFELVIDPMEASNLLSYEAVLEFVQRATPDDTENS